MTYVTGPFPHPDGCSLACEPKPSGEAGAAAWAELGCAVASDLADGTYVGALGDVSPMPGYVSCAIECVTAGGVFDVEAVGACGQ